MGDANTMISKEAWVSGERAWKIAVLTARSCKPDRGHTEVDVAWWFFEHHWNLNTLLLEQGGMKVMK